MPGMCRGYYCHFPCIFHLGIGDALISKEMQASKARDTEELQAFRGNIQPRTTAPSFGHGEVLAPVEFRQIDKECLISSIVLLI